MEMGEPLSNNPPLPELNRANMNSYWQDTPVEEWSAPSSSRSKRASSTHTTRQRTALVKADYVACFPDELSLVTGEVVELIYRSASVVDDWHDYILCRGNGGEGYAPKTVSDYGVVKV